jgi:hypothetical protein
MNWRRSASSSKTTLALVCFKRLAVRWSPLALSSLPTAQHNIESSREQHLLDRQQLEPERQGQITERFNKAIDHLGSD